MSNIVFHFFIRDLKKRFFNHKFWIHAKLPGYIVFPDPALNYLCKKVLTRHESRTVGRKKKNNRCRCINCVNHYLRVVDSRII